MAILERLNFSPVSGTGDARGALQVYFDRYYYGTIHPVPAGWRVSLYREGLSDHSTVDDAKRAVFEWFAVNRPR